MSEVRDRSELSILVVGAGSIGRRHIGNLLALGVGRVMAVEIDNELRARASEEFHIDVYDSLAAGLAEYPAAVVVAAPTSHHAEIATQAADRACALFIEKPLTHSLSEAESLCAIVEGSGLVSMVACNMRFHPGPARIKELLAEGAIGKALASRIHTGSYLPGWRPSQDYRRSYSASLESGGAVLDCIHELDLALWYFGSADVVGCHLLPAESLDLDVDGLAEILLLHGSGTLSSVHLNFVQRNYHRSAEIIGSLGTIAWDFGWREVRLFGADGEVDQIFEQPAEWDVNRMYLDELDHFINAVANRRETVNTVRASLDALRIALQVRASTKQEWT